MKKAVSFSFDGSVITFIVPKELNDFSQHDYEEYSFYIYDIIPDIHAALNKLLTSKKYENCHVCGGEVVDDPHDPEGVMCTNCGWKGIKHLWKKRMEG